MCPMTLTLVARPLTMANRYSQLSNSAIWLSRTWKPDQRFARQVKKIEIGREYFILEVFEQADNAHGGFWLGAAQDSYLVSSNGKTDAFKMDGRTIGTQLQHRIQR